MKNLFFFFLIFTSAPAFSQEILLVTDASWRSSTGTFSNPNWQNAGCPSDKWRGWSAVSIVDPTCLSTYGQTPVIGTLPIWGHPQGPYPNCSTGAGSDAPDIVYLRACFTASPVEGNCTYHLTVRADNNSVIYINGILVGSTSNNWSSGTIFNITSAINTGSNIIAVQATDFETTGWFSAEIKRSCL